MYINNMYVFYHGVGKWLFIRGTVSSGASDANSSNVFGSNYVSEEMKVPNAPKTILEDTLGVLIAAVWIVWQ